MAAIARIVLCLILVQLFSTSAVAEKKPSPLRKVDDLNIMAIGINAKSKVLLARNKLSDKPLPHASPAKHTDVHKPSNLHDIGKQALDIAPASLHEDGTLPIGKTMIPKDGTLPIDMTSLPVDDTLPIGKAKLPIDETLPMDMRRLPIDEKLPISKAKLAIDEKLPISKAKLAIDEKLPMGKARIPLDETLRKEMTKLAKDETLHRDMTKLPSDDKLPIGKAKLPIDETLPTGITILSKDGALPKDMTNLPIDKALPKDMTKLPIDKALSKDMTKPPVDDKLPIVKKMLLPRKVKMVGKTRGPSRMNFWRMGRKDARTIRKAKVLARRTGHMDPRDITTIEIAKTVLEEIGKAKGLPSGKGLSERIQRRRMIMGKDGPRRFVVRRKIKKAKKLAEKTGLAHPSTITDIHAANALLERLRNNSGSVVSTGDLLKLFDKSPNTVSVVKPDSKKHADAKPNTKGLKELTEAPGVVDKPSVPEPHVEESIIAQMVNRKDKRPAVPTSRILERIIPFWKDDKPKDGDLAIVKKADKLRKGPAKVTRKGDTTRNLLLKLQNKDGGKDVKSVKTDIIRKNILKNIKTKGPLRRRLRPRPVRKLPRWLAQRISRRKKHNSLVRALLAKKEEIESRNISNVLLSQAKGGIKTPRFSSRGKLLRRVILRPLRRRRPGSRFSIRRPSFMRRRGYRRRKLVPGKRPRSGRRILLRGKPRRRFRKRCYLPCRRRLQRLRNVQKPKPKPKPIVNTGGVTPEIKIPKMDKPKMDKPIIDKAKMDKPKMDKPIIDKPKIDKPKMDKPKMDKMPVPLGPKVH